MAAYRRVEQTFIVTGSGFFPVDMLRYDHCFPMTKGDSGLIEQNRELRSVKIRRYALGSKDVPTADRWKSFGWIVSSVETEK